MPPLRSALLLGDIHTEVELLRAALAFAPRVHRVLSVGDIVDGPDDPLQCIELLRGARADVVAGNHERWVDQGHPLEPFDDTDDAIAWISDLPATRDYDTPSGRLRPCHGIGDNDMARLHPDTTGYALECLDAVWELVHGRELRFVVGGHTHVPMVRTIETVTFINPGTLVRAQDPGFMLADFTTGVIERWTLLPQPALAESYQLSPTS